MENNEKINVNNSEINNKENNPKQNNSKTIILIVITMILILAIGIGGGFLLANKENNANNTNTTEIKTNKQEQTKTSKKIDESKPWVYDANYGENKTNKVVENDNNSNKDLKVPYINIDSEDAQKANEEIKNIYEEMYSKYGDKTSYGAKIIYLSDYKFYENGNILSVVLRTGDAVINGGAGTSKTYIYNFNLETLKNATLKEMAVLCGFNSESDVENKVKQWEKKQEELAKANPDKVAAQMMGVVDGQYFVDNDKKLNFICISLAAGNYYTPWVVEPNKEIEDFYEFDDNSNSTVVDNTNNKQENTTKTSKLKYENYPFYFYAPESWNCKIKKVDNSQYKVHSDDEYYEITGIVNGKEEIAFSIMITSDRSYDNSSWVNIGDCDNGKYIYKMQRFICRDNDGINHNSNDYKFENEVSEAMKTLTVKYKVVNEFGSANETKILEGICFKRGQPGTSARADIYYIKDGNLCKTSLTDGFKTSILASNTRYIDLSEDGKIHAYPEGSSFMNNIAQDDENVVYENIN